MTPEEIESVYTVLAEEAPAYANALIDRAGAAQSSIGTLANAVKGGSQTANVGNYTYNRLARPVVDTTRDQLIVEGLSQSMDARMSNALKAARNNYQNAVNAYNRRSSGGGGTSSTTPEETTGSVQVEVTEEEKMPEQPSSEGLVESGYKFGNIRSLGNYGLQKMPTSIDSPLFSTDYDTWRNQHKNLDNEQAAAAWRKLLDAMGYGG